MTGERPSGLRDPAAAVRGVGAGTLAVEAVVLLLAIQPLRTLGGSRADAAVWAVVGFAVAALALAGLLRRRWAWAAGAGLQLALVGAGLLHWSLAVLGLVFGAVWGYLAYVRRRVLG
ncbi:MAG TPA: DUF4233 domain-containing protein [Micromonosporaceae bacterium]|nr:DUF4233 domain-containing protein [Micromonosporaceae bacterium]